MSDGPAPRDGQLPLSPEEFRDMVPAPADDPGSSAIPPRSSARRLVRSGRLALALGALGLAAMLVVAWRLEPDPNGYGTHRQLGLGPCSFRLVTGVSCPSCGMTTAVAWTVRGRLDRAAAANPAGALLALLAPVLIVWMAASALLGRPVGTRTMSGPLSLGIALLLALSLAAWTIRLWLFFRSVNGRVFG